MINDQLDVITRKCKDLIIKIRAKYEIEKIVMETQINNDF